MAETPMPAWFAALDDADRADCVRELFTLGAGLLENLPPDHPGPLEAALVAWKATGEALADPVTREVLTSPHNPDDFVEVSPPTAKHLVLHVEIPGFYADDLDQCAAVYSEPDPPGPQDRLDVVTEEWMRDEVGITLVSLPGEKCMSDDFEVHAYKGRIVGAETREVTGRG